MINSSPSNFTSSSNNRHGHSEPDEWRHGVAPISPCPDSAAFGHTLSVPSGEAPGNDFAAVGQAKWRDVSNPSHHPGRGHTVGNRLNGVCHAELGGAGSRRCTPVQSHSWASASRAVGRGTAGERAQDSQTVSRLEVLDWSRQPRSAYQGRNRQYEDCTFFLLTRDLIQSLEALLDAGDTILTEKPVYPYVVCTLSESRLVLTLASFSFAEGSFRSLGRSVSMSSR